MPYKHHADFIDEKKSCEFGKFSDWKNWAIRHKGNGDRQPIRVDKLEIYRVK